MTFILTISAKKRITARTKRTHAHTLMESRTNKTHGLTQKHTHGVMRTYNSCTNAHT